MGTLILAIVVFVLVFMALQFQLKMDKKAAEKFMCIKGDDDAENEKSD